MDIAIKNSAASSRPAAQKSAERPAQTWTLAEKLFVGGFFAFVVGILAVAVVTDPSLLINAASDAANFL
jgi:hypothetical protein